MDDVIEQIFVQENLNPRVRVDIITNSDTKLSLDKHNKKSKDNDIEVFQSEKHVVFIGKFQNSLPTLNNSNNNADYKIYESQESVEEIQKEIKILNFGDIKRDQIEKPECNLLHYNIHDYSQKYEVANSTVDNKIDYELIDKFPPIYRSDGQRVFRQISNKPRLFVEGFSRFDVQQGELGDCWFLVAVANLTLNWKLFSQIVPDDQGFENDYAGIFHFRFWQYGKWVDVVIDDRLPTYGKQLIFLHSKEKNEFWSALLEKAYAKLHGSYEALKHGSACEAMEDLTGGLTEMHFLKKTSTNLFPVLLHAYQRCSLMGCSIDPDYNSDFLEEQTAQGLVKCHAYSITRVYNFDIETSKERETVSLLRIRNPWGNSTEWNGPWSDGSPEWNLLSESTKKELGLSFEADGEFWMTYSDFLTYFNRLEICNVNPHTFDIESAPKSCNKKWEMSVFEGFWRSGVTAGGCRNSLETFWQNPQYLITLTVPDNDNENLCTVIISLMQKNRRCLRVKKFNYLSIGFIIYKINADDPKPLSLKFFKHNTSFKNSGPFCNSREVNRRFKVPPGTYCIIPSTFNPNEEGEFLLRVYTENICTVVENEEEVGIKEIDQSVKNTISECPSPEDESLYNRFLKLAGPDQEVDWLELKDMLDFGLRNEAIGETFSKDICRSMVAMLDDDGSGKLGFLEFKRLWIEILKWRTVFKMYDTNRTGKISTVLLRYALQSAGYNINNKILNALTHRYGSHDDCMTFDDFLMCTIRLKTMIDVFHEKISITSSATANFTLEEWLRRTVYS